MNDAKTRHPEVVAAVQKARILGLVLCLAWPLVLMAMITVGTIAPGTLRAEGWVQQVGYTFTGLSLVAAAYVTWRTGGLMTEFKALPEAERPRTAFRSSLGFSILFLLSSIYGLAYWRLAGRNAFQHVMIFVALSPVMFILFAPRLHHWLDALEASEDSGDRS
jgi:hypothetical protein